MTADTIDTDDLVRQLAEGTPSRSYLLAIMPVVLDRLAAAEARVAAHEDAIYENAYKNLVRDVIDALGDDPNDWDYEGSDERLPQAIRDRLVAYEVIRESDAKRIAALTAAARACVDTMSHWKDGKLVWCSACDTDEASRGHQASCQIGALDALLDGAP
jgi:hypothetical protein